MLRSHMVSLMSVWLCTASRFSPWRGRHIRLFICPARSERTRATQTRGSVCMQCLFLAFLLPGRYFFLFCLARAVSCCFPWRNVSVAKETVALQSLMARVIAGVEQMHMTLAALLRSLGFSVDTAGTWKMYLQLNPVMTWCQAQFYMTQTLTILYKNAISTSPGPFWKCLLLVYTLKK